MLSNIEKPHEFPEKGRRHKITAKRLNSGNDAISRLIEENRRLESRMSALENKVSRLRGAGFRFIRITSQNQFDGSPRKNRWWYGCEEVHKLAPYPYPDDSSGDTRYDNEGYDNWFATKGGYKGRAYNMIENMNDGESIEGHGVDVGQEDYPDGFSVMPIAVGVIAPAWLVSFSTVPRGGRHNAFYPRRHLEAWFCIPNVDDGTCES